MIAISIVVQRYDIDIIEEIKEETPKREDIVRTKTCIILTITILVGIV